ncbi:MAG: BlaI/MecI/CopY family transcriptional regulator [Chthoniobacterales bacterium]
MKRPPKVSDAEWQVLEVIWKEPPTAAIDVIEGLQEQTGWKANTVRTLLTRLVQKGVLRTEPDGHRYLYHPLFSREQYVANESASFLERIFRGGTESLLLHFAEKSQLSEKQITELRRILEREAK